MYVRVKYQGTFSDGSTKQIEYLYFQQGMVDYNAWASNPNTAYYWQFN